MAQLSKVLKVVCWAGSVGGGGGGGGRGGAGIAQWLERRTRD